MRKIKREFDLSRLEKPTLWALLGILATIVVGIPSIYFTVRDSKPHINYLITAESNVLDIHKSVHDLEIRYRGMDIQEQRKNLKIIRIKIINDGDSHVRNGDFDISIPWGIKIEPGQIVETPKVVESNSEYLFKNVSPSVHNDKLIEFNKVILEKGKFFSVEVQLLHSTSEQFEITPFGKIAGIDQQTVDRKLSDIESHTFISKVFYGNLSVQLARIGLFATGTIIIIIIVVFTIIVFFPKNSSKEDDKITNCIDDYLYPILKNKDDKTRYIMKEIFSRLGGAANLQESLIILSSKEKLEAISLLANGYFMLKSDIPSLFMTERNLNYTFDIPKEFVLIDNNEKTVKINPIIAELIVELDEFIKKTDLKYVPGVPWVI